jgi:hypothetical protein
LRRSSTIEQVVMDFVRPAGAALFCGGSNRIAGCGKA